MHIRVLLKEERDVLLTKCSRNQTTIFDLRACLQHEKDGDVINIHVQYMYSTYNNYITYCTCVCF